MKLSKAGEDLMHKYEGFRSRPYLCPADIWTIGYGHVLYQEQIRLPMVRPPGKTKEDIPMISSMDDVLRYADIIFSPDEMAMLGGIIGFWFGSRTWSKK